MDLPISVIIPARNAGTHLGRCLTGLFAGSENPIEVILVDDGSSDGTVEIARQFPVRVERLPKSVGPALARNHGARQASGEILLFLDSDVCVRHDTVSRIGAAFERDAELAAVIGSYDTDPACPEFLSQYRNLLHAYVHQSGSERASTFWTGCGAIRRGAFFEHSGFSARYGRPAIEDIELGYRLNRASCRMILDRDIQVTHLKTWTFWGLLKTDILDRGIPWTELILRDRFMPNDLNLHLSQRVSVALVFILFALSCLMAVSRGVYVLVPIFAVVFLMLARWWIEFATPRAPRAASVMLTAIVVLIAAIAWRHGMPGIIAPLTISPILLFLRHRYAPPHKWRTLSRSLAIAYICGSLVISVLYFPPDGMVLLCFGLLAALGVMNSQFYLFLAGVRGVPFMLAAIPFHLLFHFYNGLSFIIGTVSYSWTGLAQRLGLRPSGVKEDGG